jgi:hypothetical protein
MPILLRDSSSKVRMSTYIYVLKEASNYFCWNIRCLAPQTLDHGKMLYLFWHCLAQPLDVKHHLAGGARQLIVEDAFLLLTHLRSRTEYRGCPPCVPILVKWNPASRCPHLRLQQCTKPAIPIRHYLGLHRDPVRLHMDLRPPKRSITI